MSSVTSFVRRNIFLLMGFLACSFTVFYLTRNYIDSADLIQYLSLSDQYTKLPLSEAANDFWSPLISWLLIPFSFVFGNYLFAFKAIQYLLCLNVFLLIAHLAEKMKMGKSERLLFSSSAGLMIIPYGAFNGSPDLLYLNILLFVIWNLSRNDFNVRTSIVLGVSGALLYLSKSFGIVFFPVFLFLHYFFIEKKKYNTTNFYIMAILTFLAISSVWILILSKKNQSLTISGASKYNFSIMNPKVNPNLLGEIQHPIDKTHYLPPINKDGVSAWQNPNGFNLSRWTPIDNVSHYLKVVFRNILSLVYYYFNFFILIVLALILSVLYLNRKNNVVLKISLRQIFVPISEKPIFVLLIAAFTTTFLYSLVLTQKRYLWINEIFFLFLILCLIQPASKRWNRLVLSITVLLSVLNFSKDLYQVLMSKLNCNWQKDPVFFMLNQQPDQSKIVSDVKAGAEGYTINSSLCFLTGDKNYGVLPSDSLRTNKYSVLFLTPGKKAIKPEGYPLMEFMVYSSQLNYSLYKVLPQ